MCSFGYSLEARSGELLESSDSADAAYDEGIIPAEVRQLYGSM